MLWRSSSSAQSVIMADRGYESYNIMEHIRKKGMHFLIRVKDIKSNGIAGGLNLPAQDAFDVDCRLLFTRHQTKEVKANKQLYRFFPSNQRFDFLPVGSKDFYPFHFRILRFPVSESSFEVIVTDLDRDVFPVKKIREMYHMRWGIETAFRELKYAIGLTSFHSKKVAHIHQEIFARLTMYNFCEIITTHVVIQQRSTTHIYQVYFTMAIRICLHYFRLRAGHHLMSKP